MSKKLDTEILIQVPKINLQKIVVNIKGITPLIVHKWSEKAKKQILDNQTGNKTKTKEHKVPIRDFIDATYWLSETPTEYTEEAFEKAIENGAKFGFPSIGFKIAAASAAYRNKISKDKVSIMGSFYIEGELAEIKGVPTMREDMVTVMSGGADLRYRPEFKKWSTQLNITYNSDIITPIELVNLINLSGFSVGVGEWRPEKGGQFGMFQVE